MDDFAFSSDSELDTSSQLPIALNPAPEVPDLQIQTPTAQLPILFQWQSGAIEKVNMPHFEFDKNLHSYNSLGYANNPNASDELMLDPNRPIPSDFNSVYQKPGPERRKKIKEFVKQRQINNDAASAGFTGPWGGYGGEQELEETKQQELDSDQAARLEQYKERYMRKIVEFKDVPQVLGYEKTEIDLVEPKVTFHQKQDTDWQGRNIMHPPPELKPDPNAEAYLPRRCIQTLAGHTEGVQAIRFFPTYGHLLLSASLDHTVKIWDAFGKKKCLQTYHGHSNAVRDICWNEDGTQFLSSSYDRVIRHWDTETGKVLNTFTCRRIPYCVRLNQVYPNSFIVGTSNRKIQQYDTLTGKKTLTYDEHLGAVNSICYVDGGKKFVSSSDDKKMFLWEFGIPVVVRHISEPNLHVVSYMTLHSNERHFLGQSLDNKIVVFEARGGFRHNRRKNFVGHQNGGYACAVTCSPDGKFIASGDHRGSVWFWDWKSTRNFRTLQGHDDVCIGVDWHPVLPSTVASCGWDKVIKIWD